MNQRATAKLQRRIARLSNGLALISSICGLLHFSVVALILAAGPRLFGNFAPNCRFNDWTARLKFLYVGVLGYMIYSDVAVG